MPDLIPLEQAECLRLLRSRVVGRLAFVTDDGLMVLPVNYAVVDDDSIHVLTREEGLLSTWAVGHEVTFEVDDIDESRWSGWSVLASGPCEEVPRQEAQEWARRLPRVRSWTGADRDHLLRLRWRQLGGRRLGPAT